MRRLPNGLGCFAVFFLTVSHFVTINTARADDWPQWMGPKRDGVWREMGLLEKFPEGGPKVLWRTPLGSGYSGPAVAGGRVFVMDFARATDEQGQPLRATRKGIPGSERLVCCDARDGKLVWKHEYECPYTISYPTGPRTTPLVENDRVYMLGAMGELAQLNAADGKVLWSKNLVSQYKTEPPVWGYAAHPLVDGELLYCPGRRRRQRRRSVQQKHGRRSLASPVDAPRWDTARR